MSKKRRQYSAEFKFKVALEAAKEANTLSEIAQKHQLHPNQISSWKRQLLDEGAELFSRRSQSERLREQESEQAELYEQIGRLKMELEWLKNLPTSIEAKRQLIDPQDSELSVRRQCELLGLARASYYYQPASETAYNLALMRRIDELHLKYPFFGWPRITDWLRKEGYLVNGKRIRRLMRVMNIQALYPKPRTTQRAVDHKIYPYLLRNVVIERVNQVWSSDITYLPMLYGFIYLTVVMDWYSRYVISWRLSNTLDSNFCQAALQEALAVGKPEIFNTDQGSQYTAHAFTSMLEEREIRISMDGRGRAYDNIYNERLWRSVKYEEVYLKSYETVAELEQGLSAYFHFYNHQRGHQSLSRQPPFAVYSAVHKGH